MDCGQKIPAALGRVPLFFVRITCQSGSVFMRWKLRTTVGQCSPEHWPRGLCQIADGATMAVAKVALMNAAKAEIFATDVAYVTTTVVVDIRACGLDCAWGFHPGHRPEECLTALKICGSYFNNYPKIRLIYYYCRVKPTFNVCID